MSVQFRQDGEIGYIEFDQQGSKVNVLNFEVMRKLDPMLDEVKQKKLKALVFVSLKQDIFIAGADIKEIEQIVELKDAIAKAQIGQNLMNKIEDLPFPTIAVIDGAALGGGCELILACRYRLATFNDKVRIGLPEVNLGFVPGFGGTYRLPRTIGLTEGIGLILKGKPVDSTKAFRLGLVDKVVPQTDLPKHIKRFVEEVLGEMYPRKRYPTSKKKGFEKWIDTSKIGNGMVFSKSKEGVLKATKGFYPAPLKAIEVIKQNLYMNREQGMLVEARAFGELAITKTSKNLVKLFYMSEKYKKLTLNGAEDVKPQEFRKAGCLGAGTMGGGIAQLLSSRDIFCRIKDLNWDAIALGLRSASKVYSDAVKKRALTAAQAASGMAKITGTIDYSGFKDMDIVIEAVVENLEVKKKVFAELSNNVSAKTILASNTSALSVTEIAKACKDPSKVVGFHFFNPVHRMPLVEIITTPMISRETTVSALALCKRLGKTPILVKDSAGFVVNRILLAYMNEAGRLLEETGEMEAIDKVMTDFGMPMGPFTLSDEVGMDVGIKVLHILEEAFGNRFKPVETFDKVAAAKLLGKKTKEGFYLHSTPKRQVNPKIAPLIVSKSKHSLNKEDALKRMLYVMINEAAYCMDDKIVDEPDAIDVGMIFGTGFPPFHGGLLRYADNVGIKNIVNDLNSFATKFGDRFKPAPYLSMLSAQNKNFYQ